MRSIMAPLFLLLVTACAPATGADLHAKAEASLDRLESVREKVFAEPPGPGPFGLASLFSMLSRQTKEARLKALFLHAAQDQFYRLASQQLSLGTGWASDIEPAMAQRIKADLAAKMAEVDRASHDWLKADLATNGWPKISLSKEADLAAWLLVQHSDRDLAFQRQVLALLEPLVGQGETNRSNYALLVDRVAINEGRPQRYGSQGRCSGPKKWVPLEIADSGDVDARRATMELPSLATYVAEISATCP